MATAQVQPFPVEIPEDQQCPVCTEEYRDARVLECGHHFCSVCLEEIATGHPNGHVTCPTCRHVTKTEGQPGFDHLPKYRIVNDFVANVDSARENMNKPNVSTICEVCSTNEEAATSICAQCLLVMCDKCKTDHKDCKAFDQHTIYRISPLVFCEKHKGKINVSICITCDNKLCCGICSLTSHKGHDLQEATNVAENARIDLKGKLEEMKEFTYEHKTGKRIEELLEKAREERDNITTCCNDIISTLEATRVKTIQLKEEITTKLDADIKALEMMNSDFTDYLDSKSKLENHITMLQKEICDQEIIHRVAELPRYDPSLPLRFMQKDWIDIPQVSHLREVAKELKSCKERVQIKTKKYWTEPPLQDLKKIGSFNVGNMITGLAIDTRRKRLIVRTMNKKEPISVYDFKGNKLSALGAGVPDICGSYCEDIAIDTKRDLLLVPMQNGALLQMDFNGDVKDTLPVTDKGLNGVCYSKEDIYITSSGSKNAVYLINPSTKHIISDFTHETNLTWPYYISCGTFETGETLQKIIFVSCSGGNCMKVLDYKGNFIHQYILTQPRGLCIGPGNQIFAVNYENGRLMAYICTSDSKKTGEVLLSKKEIDNGYPWVVGYAKERKLFVGDENGNITIFAG